MPTNTPSPTPSATPEPTATPTPEPTPEATAEPQSDLYTREGDYIYFGSYPQSEVIDETLKSALTNAAGATSTWTSYDYYIEGQISNFMVYKDVSFDGERYRGVYYTDYRPTWTGGGISQVEVALTYQYQFRHYSNVVYWFKYEPIRWVILTESNGEAFLLADVFLDSQDYHYTKNQTNGYDANNYEQSHIRAWLNDIFFNTAFTDIEKEIIKTTLVDNSVNSIGTEYGHSYVCNDTFDKIFLLSLSEVTNSNYGFSSNYNDKDSKRVAITTAYAMSQGANVYAYWWLRSPGDDFFKYSFYVAFVEDDGHVFNLGHDVDCTCYAVRPALWIDFGS